MPNNTTILVVDDEPLNHDLIRNALKGQHNLVFVESGEQCFAALDKSIPDLILLDIRMPGIDGYEVCRRIKSNEKYFSIPVIFVSGLDSTEERIAGYDAGGEDYVVKPFSAAELQRKVKITTSYSEKLHTLEVEKKGATQAVMEALTTTGELGVVLNFLAKSYGCNTLENLAQNLLDALSSYGLKCTVDASVATDSVVIDSEGVVKPLETALITKLKSQGRFFDFGARTVINFKNVSVLIKNMPINDNGKNGRYRDNLALLIEGAQSRINGLKIEFEVKKQKDFLVGLLGKYQTILDDFRTSNDNYKKMNAHLFDDLVVKMETEFVTLGLTEQQEDRLIRLVSETAESGMRLYEEGMRMDGQLADVVNELKKITG